MEQRSSAIFGLEWYVMGVSEASYQRVSRVARGLGDQDDVSTTGLARRLIGWRDWLFADGMFDCDSRLIFSEETHRSCSRGRGWV